MSALHVHHLRGCAPEPLASYLKALGVLRILGEQRDPDARGWWQDDHFVILTALDREALEGFLLHDYEPTPFVSPWNKGSGFFAANDAGLGPLERSTAPRLAAFRAGIEASRGPLEALARADAAVRQLKAKTKGSVGARALRKDPTYKRELASADRQFAALKENLFQPCIRSWRGAHREWLDAAVVVTEDGSRDFPSLLGTGGNDGRIDFTNNAMQRLSDLFMVESSGAPRPETPGLLSNALWGTAISGMSSAAFGQFAPGKAGGANGSTGPDAGSSVNPWDFVLMLEGSVLFSGRATRRLDPFATSRASAPFAVRPHPVGFGSTGSEKAQRGEQWMPLWPRPSTLADVRAMLGEARMQLGKATAYRPIDVAGAIARLGTARGLDRFVRYAFLERNGQSTLAVALGRVSVVERPRARLIDDLRQWLERLQRIARDKAASARIVAAERLLGDATYAALTHDDTPDRWQHVLLAAVGVESIQAGGTGFQAGPIPRLSVGWVRAADDGSAEFRLALALGSAAAMYAHVRAGKRVRATTDPVRCHWVALDRSATRFRASEGRLQRDARVVMEGRDPVADLGALLERRLIEAEQRGSRSVPLEAAPGCGATPADLAAVISGAVDLERVSGLARAFMALRWDRWDGQAGRGASNGTELDAGWVALRLAFLPWALAPDRRIPADVTILRRLRSGDAAGAVEVALSRLRAGGLRPPIRGAIASPATARLWVAALAFPIAHRTPLCQRE